VENPKIDKESPLFMIADIYARNVDKKLSEDSFYSLFAGEASRIKYGADDINRFIKFLTSINITDGGLARSTGILISALVNTCKEADVYLDLRDVPMLFIYLCYKNSKKVIIDGNVGSALGQCMRGGIIILNGCADRGVGDLMENGKIIVYGHANGDVGSRLKNGEIEINGNAGGDVGWCSDGGTITVFGTIQTVSTHSGKATVIQNGRLLMQGGKKFAEPRWK
jgi:hypothetical protein